MIVHMNAGLAPRGREILIGCFLRGERVGDVACAMGVSTNTVYKWPRRKSPRTSPPSWARRPGS